MGMLDECEVLCGAEIGHEFLEVFVFELYPVVDENHSGDAKVGKNVSFVET